MIAASSKFSVLLFYHFYIVLQLFWCVSGSSHIVEVKDSSNSESSPMSMKDLVRYFNGKKGDSVLSVACFEYSFTELEGVVDVPSIVSTFDALLWKTTNVKMINLLVPGEWHS